MSDAFERKQRGKPVRIRRGRATVKESQLHWSLGITFLGRRSQGNDPESGNLLIST